MTREQARLADALTSAYMECLRQPYNSKFRIEHQALYAHLVDALAYVNGAEAEVLQSHFEQLAASENDDE